MAGDDGGVVRGRLVPAGEAPERGERALELARGAGFVVEEILSGRLEGPADYLQDHDEWVVVLQGGAVLDAGGTRHELGAGDWMLIPAGVAHRLVSTEPGTRWIAVHGGPAG